MGADAIDEGQEHQHQSVNDLSQRTVTRLLATTPPYHFLFNTEGKKRPFSVYYVFVVHFFERLGHLGYEPNTNRV